MSNARHFMLLRPSDVTLPESFGWRREPPRRPEERQPGYMEKFDFRTLYYDVFTMDGAVIGVGPPLRNLKTFIDSSEVRVDGKVVGIEVSQLDRVQITTFSGDFRSANVLSIENEVGNVSCTIGGDLASLFEGRNVIATKSKDNRLEWIRDWARYYVSNHMVDGLLLHDNGSTEYSAAELLDSLRTVRGLKACVVVDWNFPWGAPGGVWAGNKSIKWDSDYCQYGILEHARRRFLRKARVVISQDIDELLVTPDGVPIGDLVESQGVPGLEYEGKWIETIGMPPSGGPRFFNFSYTDVKRAPCTKKWVLSPSAAQGAKQWRVHSVAGAGLVKSDRVAHRHFMGINNNWKRSRTQVVEFVEGRHVVDDQLSESMARAFATPASFLKSGARHGKRIVGQIDAAESESFDESAYPAYWSRMGSGFSNYLGCWLVSLVIGEAVRNVQGTADASGAVASSGALLNELDRPGLTIWGSGASREFSSEDCGRVLANRPRRVVAVRGRATHNLLVSIGIQVDSVLGDPVLLLPRFYSPRVTSGGVVVCADSMHEDLLVHKDDWLDDCRILGIHRPASVVVSDIANARCCISSSLYGLIVAQAYGVPWLWLRVCGAATNDTEFQFHDFFSTLDGDIPQAQIEVSDLQGAQFGKLAEKARLPRFKYRTEDLLDAFPARAEL